MCPPACHLTSAEERELRMLILDAAQIAAEVGQAQSLFHRIHIKARRLSTTFGQSQQSEHWADVPMEVLITRDREVLSHTYGAMHDIC